MKLALQASPETACMTDKTKSLSQLWGKIYNAKTFFSPHCFTNLLQMLQTKTCLLEENILMEKGLGKKRTPVNIM